MNFARVLEQYMEMLSVKTKQLALLCGISESKMRRYYNGNSAPKPDSAEIGIIAEKVAVLAAEKGLKPDGDKIFREFKWAAYEDSNKIDYPLFVRRFNLLVRALSLNLTLLSQEIGIDLPSLSRFRNGSRKSRNPELILEATVEHVLTRFRSSHERQRILELTDGLSEDDYLDAAAYREHLCAWLSGRKGENEEALTGMLCRMEEFDISHYLRVARIGKSLLPVLPFRLPASRTFLGTQGMQEGILAFLRSSVLSKSMADVVIYSDHPVEHCLEDQKFAKAFERGMAAVLVKGLRVSIIHDLNRSFPEMMLGLESWIPLYMTGQVVPYYLEPEENQVFKHLIMVSGGSAIFGESISGHPEQGVYHFVRDNASVGTYRLRAEQILGQARPLVRIYDERKKAAFRDFWDRYTRPEAEPEDFQAYATVPELFTISDALLEQILTRCGTDPCERKRILQYAARERERFACLLENNHYTELLSAVGPEEFAQYPLRLSLSNLFCKKDIFYTYEEYRQHLAEAEQAAAAFPNYTLQISHQENFRNLRILCSRGQGVLLSKNDAPHIHFHTRHPRICESILRLEMPLRDPD